MAGRVKGNGRVALPLAPDPKRDLLRHRAARHEHGRLLAEQLGHTLLEALHTLTRAVSVLPLVRARRVGELEQRLTNRRRAVPGVEEPLGARDGSTDARLVIHMTTSSPLAARAESRQVHSRIARSDLIPSSQLTPRSLWPSA